MKIYHLTEYRFTHPVNFLDCRLPMRSRGWHDLRFTSSRLRGSTDSRRIESGVVIEQYAERPLDLIVDQRSVAFPFAFEPGDRTDLISCCTHTWPNNTTQFRQWVARFWQPSMSIQTFSLLNQMSQAIEAEFAYGRREEPGVQNPDESIFSKAGSCRDFSTLLIEGCRYLGLVARFVSDYLFNPSSLPHGSTHA